VIRVDQYLVSCALSVIVLDLFKCVNLLVGLIHSFRDRFWEKYIKTRNVLSNNKVNHIYKGYFCVLLKKWIFIAQGDSFMKI
jgi:hypothetical protein